MLGCLKDFCMGREQQNLTAEATAAPALLRSGCQLWNHAAQPLVFPITSPWEVGVSFPVPTFPSKSQSPFRHPGQRDTLFEREAGTYLRLRRVRLAQRAPISAATPVSLMELLCRLQTEERTHLVWLSQDLEGATSPAEALNFTGSWGGGSLGQSLPHSVLLIIPRSSPISHIPAPPRSGQVGLAKPALKFRLPWFACLQRLWGGGCALFAAPRESGTVESSQCGVVPSSLAPHQGHCS